jgi:uroporphyrinogen decarboxylase
MHEVFGTDLLLPVAVYYGPAPTFSYEVLEETETTRVYVNHEGIVMREFKEHRDTSMPQFVKFPVENEDDFEVLEAERLGLNVEARFTAEWKERVRTWKDTEWPRRCWADRWGGFFGPLRNLMGLEGLCIAFYEQPQLIERMMAQRAEVMIEITRETLKHTDFEVFWFWEDMAYNHGPLIDPKMFRRFALPHYRRVCDWLRSQGIEHIWLDSDGDIHDLIPIWIEAGINGLWPFEVQAGMDVVEIRRLYGHDLAVAGGINKRDVAQGGDAMRRAVDRVMPLVEDGGYFPELDHSAPPDISWANFCEYMEYLLLRLGRG